jgi:hypothetical protein
VGSTRQSVLSKTFSAAIETVAADPSAAHIAAVAATASSTADHRFSSTIFASRHHASHVATTPQHSMRGVVSLLHPVAGRHALDELASRNIVLVRALRPLMRRAVKNLRITASAVLLLNFREVRDFHLCSTSVAV